MTITDSEHQMRLQIEQAAIGCVSGTGAEWPHLVHALRHYGKQVYSVTFAKTLREFSKEVCWEQGWMAAQRSLDR